MKKILAIAFIPLILVAQLRFTFVRVSFSVAQVWIAEQLCENRDKPEVLCLGSCVLEKAMNTAEKESPVTEKTELQQLLNYSYLPLDFHDFSIPAMETEAGLSFSSHYNNRLQGRAPSVEPQPPRMLA